MAIIVKHLYTYPIKSCYPKEHLSSAVFKEGLEHDRELALVDANGELLTGRKYPKLVSIRAQIKDNLLLIKHNTQPINFELSENGDKNVKLFDMEFKAESISAEASRWFSEFIGIKCTLVRNSTEKPRFLKEKYGYPMSKLRMPDGAPILLINMASIDELNTKLKKAVKPIAFRPNIIIDGLNAREEHSWKTIKIGQTTYDIIADCKRCIFTGLDYYTFEYNEDSEPLRSLATYSTNKENKVIFGVYLLPRSEGSIAVDNELEVIA